MDAGESNQQFWMQKRVGWLACTDCVSVYERATRLQAIGKMPFKRWEPWIRRDVGWLTEAMTDLGGYNGVYAGSPLKGYGDNANSQYAVLGFWAAQQAGYDVPAETWQKLDTYWREGQFPADADSAAGWATVSHKSLKPGSNPNEFIKRVAGPMTAAGVLSLSLSERFINNPKLLSTGNKATPEMAKGLKWLDTHFSLDDLGADADLYYYLWTIQNVGPGERVSHVQQDRLVPRRHGAIAERASAQRPLGGS